MGKLTCGEGILLVGIFPARGGENEQILGCLGGGDSTPPHPHSVGKTLCCKLSTIFKQAYEDVFCRIRDEGLSIHLDR